MTDAPAETLNLGAEIAPDEPLFLLRASDPVAHLLVVMWSCLHDKLGDLPPGGVTGALFQASDMERWTRAQGHNIDTALMIWADVLREAKVRLPEPVQTMN
jgi:hypothetical protein